MEDVAAAAEVGKGTLYRYFKDKEELYLALLERAACGISARLKAETHCAKGIRDRLQAVIRAIVGYFDENPHLFDLIQHAEAMSRPQRIAAASALARRDHGLRPGHLRKTPDSARSSPSATLT